MTSDMAVALAITGAIVAGLLTGLIVVVCRRLNAMREATDEVLRAAAKAALDHETRVWRLELWQRDSDEGIQWARRAAMNPRPHLARCGVCRHIDFESAMERELPMPDETQTICIHPKCRPGTRYDRRKVARSDKAKGKGDGR